MAGIARLGKRSRSIRASPGHATAWIEARIAVGGNPISLGFPPGFPLAFPLGWGTAADKTSVF
jgi:hypothetical protein